MTTVLLILGGAVLACCAIMAIQSKNLVKLKDERDAEKAKAAEADRVRRLAEADTEALLHYMAQAEEMEIIHDDDYVEFKAAADKHSVVSGVMDRLYGLHDDD